MAQVFAALVGEGVAAGVAEHVGPSADHRTARLETANGYRPDGTIMAVKFLLGHAPAGGYYTPSRLMGARCVELLPGSTPIRVD
jgi:short subunit dehydrogenase-like uncharacterized protein